MLQEVYQLNRADAWSGFMSRLMRPNLQTDCKRRSARPQRPLERRGCTIELRLIGCVYVCKVDRQDMDGASLVGSSVSPAWGTWFMVVIGAGSGI
jgi:hypothetical protein